MLRTSTKNPIDFQHHYRLVSAAAVQFDDSLTHEDDPWDPGDSFDIDTPVYDLEAKAHVYTLPRQRSQSMGSPDHRRNQRILLPTEIWHAFSDEGKLAWDTLPEADRKMILAKIKPTNNPRIVQLHQQKQGEDMEELQDASADSPVETEQCNDKLQDHKAPQLQPSIWATFLAKDKSAPICQANMCVTIRSVFHRVSSTSVKSNQSPVDRRTNVGIACQDCKVTYVSDRTGDAEGMDNYQLSSISSSTAAGYAVSNKGPVILILNQYALMGRRHSIHSPEQLGWFKNSVCGKSIHVGGMQRIETADGYINPIRILNGLPYVWMRKPTDKQFDILPHVMLTHDNTRDPAIIDLDHEEDEEEDKQWIDAIEDIHTTFQHIAQLVRTPTGTLLQQVHRSQNLALNVIRKGETVAIYELFSGTPAVECGATRCQVFVGMTTDVTNVNPLQTSTPYVNLLEGNVRSWGAPTKLVSDSDPIDISGRVNIVSLTALLGVTVDTSVLLWYHLWQPLGCALTRKILDAVMSKVLHQLLLRHTSEGALNIRLGTIGGEAPTYVRPTIFSKFLFSKFDDPLNDGTNCTTQMSQGIQHIRDSVINDKGDTIVPLICPIQTTKEFRAHLVVAVNHDGFYKAWLVDGGHLTYDHLESVYYGVVSVRSFQIVMILAELTVNGLEFWSTDIGYAHLESYPDRENCILITSRALHGHRALYDLKLSGQGWHDGMHDCLVALGLLPCRAKPDIWMRKNGELQVWEYIVLCIGDLAIVMQHPRVPIGSLTPKLFEFKLKGIGKISDHLRIQFSQDEDRILQLQQQKYPKKMTEGYVRFFGSKSRTNAYVPLERGDHPETNLRSFLNKIYQSLIGSLQWIITIGWFNTFPTLITMSLIQDTPRYRHFEKITSIHSCLSVVV
ncbi:reverse transcriptase RNA-dependent DNA polymerase [Nitzschia inconspicua]|uniref:Reverse transcriptase RNA-dependent DNA polymerase n=1 Tax=Nitzschia inconspicua TaxID=303405 RepID=A0A9K3L9J0_9STRA|nr:reverse transcriptase RNA-dependent DNA polymerase [Nitzschia inconspicua]